MSTKTTNYNLNKYDEQDEIIDTINGMSENMDIIDSKIKEVENKAENAMMFIPVYGETTYEEIQKAINAGKMVVLNYGGTHRLQLTYTSAEQFNFAGFVDAGNTLFNAVCNSQSQWSLESNTFA